MLCTHVVAEIADAPTDGLVVGAVPLLPVPRAPRQHAPDRAAALPLRTVVELLLELDLRVLVRREGDADDEHSPGLLALEVETLADLATAHSQQQRTRRHGGVVLVDGLGEAVGPSALHHHALDIADLLPQPARLPCLRRAFHQRVGGEEAQRAVWDQRQPRQQQPTEPIVEPSRLAAGVVAICNLAHAVESLDVQLPRRDDMLRLELERERRAESVHSSTAFRLCRGSRKRISVGCILSLHSIHRGEGAGGDDDTPRLGTQAQRRSGLIWPVVCED